MKNAKKLVALLFVVILGFAGMLFVGCGDKEARLKLEGAESGLSVTQDADISTMITSSHVLKYKKADETWETVATGYTEMKEKGVFFMWPGSSAEAKEKQTNGTQLVLSITYNGKTIQINYTIS